MNIKILGIIVLVLAGAFVIYWQYKRAEIQTLIVVFTKETNEQDAENIIKNLGLNYHKGGDGGRGKIYFYQNGPQFSVKVPGYKINKVEETLSQTKEVFEVYVSDLNIQKD